MTQPRITSSKLTNKGTGAIPLRRLSSPCAPLEDSLRLGERPTNGSDEGTYRKGLPCNPKNYFAKNATRYLHTQDFIVVSDQRAAA